MSATQHFAIQLKRSPSGSKPTHRATLQGMGLTRMGRTVYLKDTPAIRGMIYKVVHLVDIERCEGPPPPSSRQKARAS